MARPRGPETKVIRIPVDKIHEVETVLGRKLSGNPRPCVQVRLRLDDIDQIKDILK